MHPVPAPTPTSRITRRQLLAWITAAAGTSGLMACGGGGGGSDGGGATNPPGGGGGTPPPAGSEPTAPYNVAGKGAPGAPVTVTERISALQSVEARLTSLFDATTGRASAAQLLAHLATLPAFKTIGYSATGDVYAIFTDGRPLLITVDARTTTDGVSDGPAMLRAPADRAKVQRATRTRERAAAAGDFEAGIPSKQFRYLNTWFSEGPPWPAKAWCREQVDMGDIGMTSAYMTDFGYEKVELGDAAGGVPMAITVEGLKHVSGDGVFFWTTHGGTLDPNGNIVQGLMTGTTAFQSTVEDTYADEFAEGTLIYYTGPLCMSPTACLNSDGGGLVYTRLAITPKFIRKYAWSFGDYSLVFVNACASATGEMKQAFVDAGASLYLGWTKPVRLWAMCGAALDFFSLMLGLNENGGANGLPPEVLPRQRPYAWGDVLELMQQRVQTAYYQDDEDGLVELEPTWNMTNKFGFLALRPSIYWTSFDEYRSEWRLIGGMYGTQQGTAKIGTEMPCGDVVTCTSYGRGADYRLSNGTAVEISDWASENIVLKIPRSGAGSAGILQLDVDGRWSNGVQLTRITLPVHATRTYGGSLQVSVDTSFAFRNDYRGVRLKPVQDELTFLPTVISIGPPTADGTWTASGRYTYPQGQETITIEWSGTGNLSLAEGVSGVNFVIMVDPKTRASQLAVTLSGTGVREKTTVSRPGYPDQVSTRTIAFGIASMVGGNATPSVPVQFAADYSAGPANVSFTETTDASYNEQVQTTTMVIGPFSAEYPPDERIGGR